MASGLYWNYFYHTWKTISSSPFANAVVFVTSDANIVAPDTITVHVDTKDEADYATVFTLSPKFENAGLEAQNVNFIQTVAMTSSGIAMQKYGVLMIPKSQLATEISLEAEINGAKYKATKTNVTGATTVGTAIELTKRG